MKKKFIALLLGALVLFNTVGSGFTTYAEDDIKTVDIAGQADSDDESSLEEVVDYDDNTASDDKSDLEEKAASEDNKTAENDVVLGDTKSGKEEPDSGDDIPKTNDNADDKSNDDKVTDVKAGDDKTTGDKTGDDNTAADKELDADKDIKENEDDKDDKTDTNIKSGNIAISASDGVLPEGASIEASAVGTDSISSIKASVEEALSNASDKVSIVNVLAAYDINISVDGANLQPNGKVSVTLTGIDTSVAGRKMVYYIAPDGTVEPIEPTAVGDGEVTFETTHFSVYAVVSIEENAANPTLELDEYALINKVIFTDADGNEISDNSTVSLDAKYEVTYELKSPLGVNYSEDYQTDENKLYISKGNTYKLPSINSASFNISSIPSFKVYAKENGNQIEFGEINVDSDGNVRLAVTYDDNKDIYNIVIKMEFGLNSASIGTSDKFEFIIPTATGTKTVSAFIEENQPKAPIMSKIAGNLDANDDIEWTVTIKNDSNPIQYENGYYFVDSFSDNQSYVQDSFEVNGSAVTPTFVDGKLAYSFTNNNIDATTIISYKTHVDFLSSGSTQNGTIKLNIKNDAKLYDEANKDKPIVSDSVQKEVSSKNLANWIIKSGGELDTEGVASWEIIVDTNGYNLKNLTIYDVFATDTTTVMSLVDGSVVVKDTVGETETTLSSNDYDIYDSKGSSEKGKAYNWSLKLKGPNSDYKLTGNHKYTITYKTKIEDYPTFLRTNHTIIPGNYAFLEYEYDYTGNGNGYKLLAGPTLSKINVTANGKELETKTAVKKEYISFDASTHTIKWKITANNNKQALTNSVISEIVGDGQTFDSISDVTITGASGTSTLSLAKKDSNEVAGDYTVDSAKKNVVIKLGDELKNATATFTVVTKLTDAESGVWAGNNNGKKYFNTVQLDSDQQKGVTDTASCTYKSTVIKKEASRYNYDSHQIDYTITVNQNKMAMSNIDVTDDIGSLGLSLVEGSVKLQKGNNQPVPLESNSSNESYYTDNAGNLTFHLENITDVGSVDAVEKIIFSAQVDDGAIFTDTNGQNVSTTNTAELKIGENPNKVPATATTTWKNTVIKKESSVNTTTKEITYTVVLNGNKQELNPNLIIRDTLGSSLALDLNSVKLFVGEINPETGVVTSTGMEESDYLKSMYASGKKTVLDVTLPQKQNNRTIYYLTYKAMPIELTNSGDYTNGVQLVGYASNESNNATANVSYSSFGGGWTVDPFFLNVTKIDKDDPTKTLSGAKFVIKDEDDNIVDTIVTKANGKAVSVGKLAKNKTYTIEEIEAPADYNLSSQVITFTMPSEGGVKKAVNLNFEDKRKSLAITISKEDGKGNQVSGANIKIKRTLTDGSDNVTNWTTAGEALDFDAAVGIEYTIHEDSAPFGYNKASDIIFKVDENTLYVKENGEFKASSSLNITMVDTPKESFSFKVNKISASQGKNLSGAKLVISSNSNKNVLEDYLTEEWITDATAKTFAFPAGTYYLHELEAPAGYQVAESIEFVITSDLKLEINGEEPDDNQIFMADEYDETKTVSFTLSPDELGIEQDLFRSMKFKLFTFDVTDNALVEVEPEEVSNSDDGSEELEPVDELNYKLKYQEEYILKPEGQVEGYKPINPITIKIVEDEVDGEKVDKILTKSFGDDGEEVFTEVSLAQLGGKMTPELIPVIPEEPEEPEQPQDENPQDEPAEQPAEEPVPEPTEEPVKEPVVDDVKDNKDDKQKLPEVPSEKASLVDKIEELIQNVISDNDSEETSNWSKGTSTDTIQFNSELAVEGASEEGIMPIEQSEEITAGVSLAKTGGFLGTLIAYLTAIIVTIVGLYLLFSKEKNPKKYE